MHASNAFSVAQAVYQLVADDAPALGQGVDAIGGQSFRNLWRTNLSIRCAGRGRAGKGAPGQLADDLAQRLFFALRHFFGGKQDVIGYVERGTHNYSNVMRDDNASNIKQQAI
jgi:hypothetical protein